MSQRRIRSYQILFAIADAAVVLAPSHFDGFKPDPDSGWCVWDNETSTQAEANGMRYINLRYDEAVEGAEELNNPE